VTARRSRGDGGLHWDGSRKRWIATITIGYDARGKRVTRKASGKTKTEAKLKLREILRNHEGGLTSPQEATQLATRSGIGCSSDSADATSKRSRH
jgi:hypothetical protein